MLDPITIQKITDLSKVDSDEGYQKIRQILLDHIKANPTDIDVRLKLIKHTYSTRPVDTLDIIDYINDLLCRDPNNIYALLYLAYIQTFELGGLTEYLLDKLLVYKSDDSEIMAMIAIAISRHYELFKQVHEQERWLRKSIRLNPQFVANYYELIVLYFYNGRKNEGKELIPFALNNIKHVFNEYRLNDKYLWDTTDVEEFFNVRYKEIHVSQSFIDKLLSWQRGESEPFFKVVIPKQ